MVKEKETDCMLCGNHLARYRDEVPGYQEPKRFHIYSCRNCDTSFALPKVDPSRIYQTIYNAGDQVPGYSRYWEYARSVLNYDDPLQYLIEKEDVYWAVTQALLKLVDDKTNTQILEIGCGVGYFTYALRKAGYQVTGLDISQSAVSRAVELFGDYYLCGDINDCSILKKGSYNVVIMTEVLEHIDNPIVLLESVKNILCNEGFVIVTTPNKSFFDDEIAWETELPPVHQWWFSESSL
ncbi:MAG: class I SAM-dependent methyltransferase, partial [Bacteroidales bacterium]|nr:class I SAM-dependent methyltransferase [Bacteroidales bacterium]